MRSREHVARDRLAQIAIRTGHDVCGLAELVCILELSGFDER
jgi:hypothetical protein